MHLSEFKAWFEGFTEGMKGVPTKEQWARIKKRVGEIIYRIAANCALTNDYTPAPIFIDRYWEPYRKWMREPYVTFLSDKTTIGGNEWKCSGKAEYLSLSH